MVAKKDILAGLVFIGFALLFGITALMTLTVGTPTRMGPGYFPLVLASLLGLLGLGILINGIVRDTGVVNNIPWRGLVAILATPIVFGATVQGLGMIPSLILTVVVSGLASADSKPLTILSIAVGLTAFCVAVFHYGLGITIPLLGTWIPF